MIRIGRPSSSMPSYTLYANSLRRASVTTAKRGVSVPVRASDSRMPSATPS